MWTIRLLGGLAVVGPQQVVTRFRTQKAASLLAYLAFHGGRGAPARPREVLLEVLWPEADLDAGRHNLSNALSVLRRVLEPAGVAPGTVILADQHAVRLNPDVVQTDIDAFAAATAKASTPGLPEPETRELLLQAAELYRGTLLPGFYEEWIPPEAARLDGTFLRVVARLVPLLLSAGQLEAALAQARRAVAADSLSERAAQQLMEVLAAAGAPSQARRIYQLLEERLREVGEAISPALQEYAAGLLSSAPLPPPEEWEKGKVGEWERPVRSSPSPALPFSHSSSPAPPDPGERLRGDEFALLTTTRFFGREAETAQLSAMLRAPRTRLVTITGPGGIGKTRLALEAASRIVATPDPAAPTTAIHVPLADLAEAGRLFEAILRALGIPRAPGSEPLDELRAVLASRPGLLLILDNFEHLVEEGAMLVHHLLGEAPAVRLLVTSRQTLRIAGEQEFHLAPLPATGGASNPEELLRIASTALFADRAEASAAGFQLDAQNAAAVGQLCDRLEGIPLAIELAAARVSVLSPARILERVSANRLDSLASRRRDVDARHRTLRAALDWSYQLLPEAGQQFLARLSVFRGGWTLEAADAVCRVERGEALDWLSELRDSSLIGVMDTTQGLRFSMLETVREYAAKQLGQSGQCAAVLERHAAYFAALAEAAEPQLRGAEQESWLRRLDAEYDNLCFALAGSLSRDEAEG